MGWGLTPPSTSYTNIKVSSLWMAVKNPYLLAFSKLVLNVKIKFVLISWHFLVFFGCAPLPSRPFIEILILVILEHSAGTCLGQVSFMSDL